MAEWRYSSDGRFLTMNLSGSEDSSAFLKFFATAALLNVNQYIIERASICTEKCSCIYDGATSARTLLHHRHQTLKLGGRGCAGTHCGMRACMVFNMRYSPRRE